jgi:hypothetical protein
MFNAGVRGKRAKDGVGFLSTAEQFNQKSFLVPTVTSFSVTDVSYVPLDDTAVDTAGGQTIVINGSGFASGATVQVGATTIGSVTFVDQSRLAFTAPALSSGSYTIYVTNNNGGTGILVSGLVYSGLPTFTTTAGTLGAVYETANINTAIVATGDAPITYTLLSGTLPAGATLNSNGTITGNAPVDGSSTTYSFTIQASDGQLQESTRSFSLTINTDVLTWGLANNTVYTLDDTTMSNVTLTATSSANANSVVTFAANTLPTGVSLSGNTIFGTPTTEQTVYSELIATATQTGRTATRFVSWTVSLSDPFFKYVSLLLKGDGTNGAQNNTFLDDSTNNFAITRNGNTTQGTFSPYGGNWSNYFDGTGDSLTGNMAQIINFGTNDFTVEFWVNFSNAVDTVFYIFDGRDSSTPSAWALYRSAGGALSWYNGASNYSASLTDTNVWTHVAWSRSGTSLRTFINGALTNTFTDTTSYTAVPATSTIGSRFNGVEYINGYISNFRIVKGTAVYTSAFTPSTTPLTAIANTSLLTCQSNSLIDNSRNNLTITRNGDVSVQRFSPFSPSSLVPTSYGWNLYTSGSFQVDTVTGNRTLSSLSTGAFTVEGWYYPTSSISSKNARIISLGRDSAGTNTSWDLYISNGSALVWQKINSTATTYSANYTFNINTWYHVVACRDGSGNLALFVNGTRILLQANETTDYDYVAGSNSTHYIGASYNGSVWSYALGYYSNIRIIKGATAYDPTQSTLTVPTTQLPVTAQTSMLLFSNIGADLAGNYPLSDIGRYDTQSKMSTFNPFGFTSATTGSYTTNRIGGSGYFDGTGDFLTVPTNATAFDLTANFTIEFWINPSAVIIGGIVSNGAASFTGNAVVAVYNQSSWANKISFWAANISATSILQSNTLTTNKWAHIAIVRSGSTLTLYHDGISVTTYTSSSTVFLSNTILNIGKYWLGNFNGYLSNIRVVKGTAVYTNNFIPPTEPVTAITNTQLLCNFTNAGIIDNAMINNLETVGNAQISTTQSKFGGSSMYFDSSGDYLIAPNIDAFNFGTGDFTIECWMYIISNPTYAVIFDTRSTSGFLNTVCGVINTAGILYLDFVYTGVRLTGSTVINTSQWYHLSISRASGVIRLFVNGTQDGSVTYATSIVPNGTNAWIGAGGKGGSPIYFDGYIDDLRITKGYARYTSNFTPPVSSLLSK